jgi:hypothetical protein
MKKAPLQNGEAHSRGTAAHSRVAFALMSALVLALAIPLRAAEPNEWKARQALTVAEPGIQVITLPVETLDAARADLGDLRVLDPGGREVAYLLQRETREPTRPAAVRSFRSILTETSTQLLIDNGDVPVTEVVLETPARDFVKRASVETSADGTAWRLLREGEPLFRQGGAERLTLRESARFLRITIDDTRSRPVPFTGAKVSRRPAEPSEAAPLTARIARREEFAGETVFAVELAAAHVPLSTLAIVTPERLFTRRVTVGVRELRDESAVERTLASGTIYNIAIEGDQHAEHRFVALDFTAPSRELMVHIANDDSPPLAVTSVQVWRYEVRLYFDATMAGEYSLLSGHPQIAAPRYDVSMVRLGKAARPIALTPGPLVTNPGYRSPEALAGTPVVGAPLDPEPWNYRKAVQLAASGVHQLELDLDVLAHAQPGFDDLRLVRDGRQIPYLLERPALSRSMELTPLPANDPKRPRISRWQVTLPRARLPLTRLTLVSPTPLFQRRLRLFEIITDDRGNSYERNLASADWSHTPNDQPTLVIPVGLPPATNTLMLETDNGDNPPLALGRMTATHPVTRLLFKSEQAPLTLYYGHPQSAAPRYDLALVANQILAAEKQIATLAAEEKARPDGWSKTLLAQGKGGVLFWSVLALVVVALLAVMAKLLPKPPAASR